MRKSAVVAIAVSLLLVASCSRDRYLVSTPWKLIRSSERLDTVNVLALSGGCMRFEKIEVDERPNEVILTALSRDKAQELADSSPSELPISCPTSLQMDVLSVCLRAPLGDRPLTHAPISAKWGKPRPEDVPIPPHLGEPKRCVLTRPEAPRTAAPTAASTTNKFGIDCERELLSGEIHEGSAPGTSALDAARHAADRRLKEYDALREEGAGVVVAMKDGRRVAIFRTRQTSGGAYRVGMIIICSHDESPEGRP